MNIKLKKCSDCNELKHIWKSDKKDKYCKECWYKIKPTKPIAPVSKKMQKTMDEYSKKRVAFLALNNICQAKLNNCTGFATDIHHKAGRGENHNNISTWLSVCRNCHTIIEINPQLAKELGLTVSRLSSDSSENLFDE